MKIEINPLQDIEIVKIEGDIDASTAPKVSKQVLPLASQGKKIIVDMTKVSYMSSAGLRMLLLLHRQVSLKKTELVLVGMKQEIINTMKVTGLLQFFPIEKTLEEGKKVLMK